MEGMASDRERERQLQDIASSLLARTRAGSIAWAWSGTSGSDAQVLQWVGNRGTVILQCNAGARFAGPFAITVTDPTTGEHLQSWRPGLGQPGVSVLSDLWTAAKATSGVTEAVLDGLLEELGESE